MGEREGLIQRLFNNYVWNTRSSVNFNDPRVPINGETIDMFYDGPASKSGKPVNQENAMTVSAMWRGIQVLGGACSSIPFKAYRKGDGGRVELTTKDTPTANIITNRPNNKVTWPVYMDRAINHLHMRGNHFAYPVRNGLGQAVEIDLWHPDTVEVFEDSRNVFYKRKNDEKVYSSDEVIHVPHLGDGLLGKSVVKYAKEDLGLEMSRRDYGSGVFATGGKTGGLLTPKQPLDQQQRDQVQKNWAATKKSNNGGDILLPWGFDYTFATFKPDELEWLEAGGFSVPTIARWLGVPPHKLYDLSRATFSNIEHMAIEFISDSIAPILTKFEYEYSDKLFQLPIEEFRGYYCEFNMNAYIRADTKTKAEANAVKVHSGQETPAEIRDRENMRFIDGSDRLFINQGSAPLDKIDEILAKKTVSAAAKEKLKAKFNGQTQDILDILEG